MCLMSKAMTMSARLKVSCTKYVCAKRALSSGIRLFTMVAWSFLPPCKFSMQRRTSTSLYMLSTTAFGTDVDLELSMCMCVCWKDHRSCQDAKAVPVCVAAQLYCSQAMHQSVQPCTVCQDCMEPGGKSYGHKLRQEAWQ